MRAYGHSCTHAWMHGGRDPCVQGCDAGMEGWMDGWMKGGRQARYTDGQTKICPLNCGHMLIATARHRRSKLHTRRTPAACAPARSAPSSCGEA